MIELALEKHDAKYELDIDTIIEIDSWTRKFIKNKFI